MKVCRECGTHEDVRRGLCRRCRGKARGHELNPEEEAHGHRPPKQGDPEPAHDQPWVPRDGLTDRVRRSPRQ
jgi:NMD protein affecting ribosome stability and mRNA decay